TAARYLEQVLEGQISQFWPKLKAERPQLRFMHDGAPSHSAKVTQRWLADHSIEILPHPPNSPDLNPIE
ncbi:hypothetical protein CYLTODRAFT_334300, partial [Cylindrobasidium torrendii FP15055 ss-10]